jgi:hypothetical protein
VIPKRWNYSKSGCKWSSGWGISRHCQTNARVQSRWCIYTTFPRWSRNSNYKTPTKEETSNELISCLAHHGHKRVYNDEVHWHTMMASCRIIVACMSIWMQHYFLEALQTTK